MAWREVQMRFYYALTECFVHGLGGCHFLLYSAKTVGIQKGKITIVIIFVNSFCCYMLIAFNGHVLKLTSVHYWLKLFLL